MHRVVDAILALLDLDLGGAADADHRNAARELGKTFLQLLAVVVGGGLLDLRLDLRDAVLDVFLLAAAVDDRGVLLVDHHLLGLAEHRQRDVLELDAKVFADRLAAGQDGDVLQHGLAAIAEAGGLHGSDFQAAAQLVDHERGQRLALDDVELGLEALGLFHRDHAFVADLFHRLGQIVADLLVAVGGDGADLGDLGVRGHLLGVLLELLDHGLDREIDTALEVHRVHAGGNRLGTFLDDRSRKHGRGRGAVTGDVGGLRGDLAHHLRAHVLELVFEFDLLGDGDAVLGDAGSAEGFIQHDVAALGAERDFHRIGECLDTAQHALARVAGKFYVFGSHDFFPSDWNLKDWMTDD